MATKKLAPVHPGEILLEEFLQPLEISQTGWRRISAYRRDASMRSFTESAPSQLILRSVFPDTSVPLSGSGSIFRPVSISRSRRIAWAVDWKRRFWSALADKRLQLTRRDGMVRVTQTQRRAAEPLER